MIYLHCIQISYVNPDFEAMIVKFDTNKTYE